MSAPPFLVHVNIIPEEGDGLLSIFKKLSTRFIGISPEEDDDEDLQEEEQSFSSSGTEIGARQRTSSEARTSSASAFHALPKTPGGAAVDHVVAAYRMNVIVIEPQSFDDAQQVAVNLQKKKPVVLNFEKTEKTVASRITDFISGTIYALNGDIKKISNNVILCAPSNVNVSYAEGERDLSGNMPWMK